MERSSADRNSIATVLRVGVLICLLALVLAVACTSSTPTVTPELSHSPTAQPPPTSVPTDTTEPTHSPTPLTISTSTPTDTPAPTHTPTPQPTPTSTPTETPVSTHTPTPPPSPTNTPTETPTPTHTPTLEPTTTSTPIDTPAPTHTPTPQPAPTSTPTDTPVPSHTPTPPPSPTSTATPSATPTPILDCAEVEHVVDISVVGSILYYRGQLNEKAYRQFLCAIKGNEDSVTTVQIDSTGGLTDTGMKIGSWIHDNNVDVIVDNLCQSSCANYIFTAATNKIIKAGSTVGWHGSRQQTEHVVQRLGTTLDDYLSWSYDQSVARRGTTPSEEGRKEFIESIKRSIPVKVMEEQAFLEKIGVRVDVMIYGLLPEGWKIFTGGGYWGWTFSIEDMAKFGIDNVTYEGEGEYINKELAAERGLLLFDVP